MSVIWSGITEEGAIVPVQVTEEGKVVADVEIQQYWTPTETGIESQSSIEVSGNGTFSGALASNESSSAKYLCGNNPANGGEVSGIALFKSGSLNIGRNNAASVIRTYVTTSTERTGTINSDGSMSMVNDKCGFTPAGEIFFTSRNTRYKLVVQNELCVAEPYPTSFMESAPYPD